MTVNYLTNRTLMQAIHDSKATFTWYLDGTHKTTQYKDYDLIVCDPDVYEYARTQMILQRINTKRFKSGLKRISVFDEKQYDQYIDHEDLEIIDSRLIVFNGEFTPRIIELAKLGKVNRELRKNNKKRVRELDDEQMASIDVNDLVLRVLTFDHIPKIETKKEYKKVGDDREKTNFPPYQHYAMVDGVVTCVAKSHHDKDCNFSLRSGRINDILGTAFMMMSGRIANKYNFRNYSYIEDMKSRANIQLVSVGLQYNELYGENPFAYYTTTVENSFKLILKEEKNVQQARDKLLMDANYNPSITAQINQELSREEHWNDILEIENNSEVTDIDITEHEDYNEDYENDSQTDVDDRESDLTEYEPTFGNDGDDDDY